MRLRRINGNEKSSEKASRRRRRGGRFCGAPSLFPISYRRQFCMNVVRENQKLVELYAQMAALTAPECAHTCRCPHACCEPFHCELTLQWAKNRWGVELERTNGINLRGEVLPLLGPKGCTALEPIGSSPPGAFTRSNQSRMRSPLVP
jgi:hypothetical protein